MQSRFDEKAVEARSGRSRDGSARRNEKRSAGNGAIPLRGSGLRRRSLCRQLTSLFPVEGRTRPEVTDTRQKQKLAAAGRLSGLGCRDSEGSAARGCSLQADAMLRFLRGEDLTEMG